jgi:hypothetical protein
MNNDKINAARYEFVRTLSPVQFAEIFKLNLTTGQPFDDIIDERRKAVDRAKEDALAEYLSQQPIGSPEWFAAFSGDVLESAKAYVREKHPVKVYESDETGEMVWAVAFAGTDFWANAFKTQADADAYAAPWNAQCAAASKP